jgi:hypothetical protein
MSRCRFLLALCLLTGVVFAQSQFVGKWHTRHHKPTGKNAITLNIMVSNAKVTGTVTLVDHLNDVIEMPVSNAVVKSASLEFETKEGDGTWLWRLTPKGKRKGLIHGNIGEMLIEEHVTKER